MKGGEGFETRAWKMWESHDFFLFAWIGGLKHPKHLGGPELRVAKPYDVESLEWSQTKLKTLLKHNVLNSLSTLYQYFTVLSAHGATDFVERLYECPMGKRISAPDVHFAQIGFKMPSKYINISRQKLMFCLFVRRSILAVHRPPAIWRGTMQSRSVSLNCHQAYLDEKKLAITGSCWKLAIRDEPMIYIVVLTLSVPII